MRSILPALGRSTLLLALLALVACGGDAGDSSASEGAAREGATRGAAPAAEAADFSAADLAAYERGFAHEIELVRRADAIADTATVAQVRNDARAAKDESVTVAEGAKVSGLGDRYASIRETVHRTLRTLDYQGKIDGPTSYDTGTAATPEIREMFTKDPVAALPAGARAAFQARLQPLAEQWGSYVRMTAVAG